MIKNKPFTILLGGWVALALIQAGLTDLANDEAYYWVYSRRLDWGYFDHPPVVALFIKAGYFLFQNELGVRLLTIISQAISLYLIFRLLIQEPRTEHFFSLVVLTPLLHAFSFIAVPDAPLLLGTVIFLVFYKQYSEEAGWGLVLPLAITMAFMMYSKYHAALVILLVMFSKPKLWLDIKWIMACTLGALLFAPHLWWQYQHEFPSLKYHLIDRNTAFEFKDVGMFIVNQLINFNPIIFGLVGWRMLKSPTKSNDFERALSFIFFGFLLFFLVMTWRGHIEPQWTYVLVVPILYYGMKFFSTGDRKLVLRSGLIIIPVLVLGRICLVTDLIPLPTEFHGYPALAEKIKGAANGKPVVVLNSYQLTAKYQFYAQEATIGMITDGRRNQYSLYRDEESLLNQEVYLISRRDQKNFEKVNTDGHYSVWGKPVEAFSYYKDVAISTSEILKQDSATLSFPITVVNPYKEDLILDDDRELVLVILEDGRAKDFYAIETDLKIVESGKRYEAQARVPLSERLPNRQAVIGIRTAGQFFSLNSGLIQLRTE